MSSSSNWNCISSDCARVVYREYLPPVVRWRYPNEEWQEIVADDYQINRELGQCPIAYNVDVYTEYTNPNFEPVTRTQTGYGTIKGLLQDNQNSRATWTLYVLFGRKDDPDEVQKAIVSSTGSRTLKHDNYSITSIYPVDPNQEDNCGECTLTITKNGEIVHEETRIGCPEVEKLPCRLSEISKEIKIDKTPFLSAIEVTQIDNDAVRIKGVPFPLQGVGKAPDECWNIYRNEIFDPFPSGDADDPNEPAFGDFISQICSAFSCPPPDYEVICDCNEQCPNGTCGVYCGEYLCCYDSTGKSVKAIHYSDIPDFGIPDNTVGINDLGGNFA